MTKTSKITKRDMYSAIMNLAKSGALHMQDFEETISDTMVEEFCANEIALLDKKAAKAKETAAKKKAAGDELLDAVYAATSEDTFEPIAVITERIQGDGVTVAKVTNRLTTLCKNDFVEKQEISVPSGEGKSRKVQGYRRIKA